MSNILVVASHADDEILGCGGVIARHVQQGDIVTVVVVCNREYGRIYDDKIIAEEYNACRKAKESLGYQRLDFLDMPDGLLDTIGVVKIIDGIEPIVNEFKPDVMYTSYYDVHQDHQMVFKASMIIARSVAKTRIKKVLCYEDPSATEQSPPLPHWTFVPNYFVDISEFIDKKIEAFKFYVREQREFPHPRSIEGIKAFAQWRGVEANLKYAEAFMMLKDVWL